MITEAAPEGTQKWERWNIFGFRKSKIVGSKSAGQRHLAKSNHEVDEPEEHEKVVELQEEDVPVEVKSLVHNLPTEEKKKLYFSLVGMIMIMIHSYIVQHCFTTGLVIITNIVNLIQYSRPIYSIVQTTEETCR